MQNPKQLLRPEAVAKSLNLKPPRLARLRLEGGGPAFIKIGRSVYYDPQDVEAFLDVSRRRSTSDDGKAGRPAKPDSGLNRPSGNAIQEGKL